MTRTHYDVLGVGRRATATELKRAYVDLARRHHPDFHTRTGGSSLAAAEREMQRINEAWLVLRDPLRRRTYDEQLHLTEPLPPVWDARAGRAHPDFVPFDGRDDDPGGFTGAGDGDDPDRYGEYDDTPYRGARPVSRWLQLLPVALLVGGVITIMLGLVANLSQMLGLGFIMLIGAGLSFLITPMVAVMRGYDPNPEK